ncbi:PREDICTED: U8 snoRNA-decapping enzyme-like [Amphimedon queenslandica]|uniref:U8 snoRNA-decapping enzyme n=1 Tax=Amphimedon queenslandica TaxID=400682 RepID=A0A1X7VWQ7_AMPQE|nr:PREDICTED: U8 snoRNA-decapping enzyme-like [Amphimedon queenslandica]|eukprot:XP_003382758.1 PREDICTED: U8 snoRNA-decapping enzyme-like [Amphimedon queenslandica]
MEPYKLITKEEIAALPKDLKQCRHCAHAMIYAKLPEKLFGRYDKRYAILMQMRFDGTLGFSGGMVDEGETVEEACTRECSEELGVSPADLTITQDDHVTTHYSDKTHFCLHFFAKEVSLELFHEIEKKATSSKDWGDEVLGIVRCPLHTLPNGLGFPAFLRHSFIGNSKVQLLTSIRERGLLTEEEVQTALKTAGLVDCVVTNDNTDY